MRSWPWSCPQQPAVTIVSCCCTLSSWILSPLTMTSSCSINDNHRRQNSSPGICLLSSGLLQLHAVRHVRRPSAEGSVHSERCCTSGHSSTMWPYHADAVSAALAACPSMSQVQGCIPGTPVAGWSDTRIHSRRHPTRYGQWSPSATFSCCQDMPHTTDAQLRQSKLQCMWNSLPPHLWRDMHFACFKHQLKTFLFGS